jgi:hypothetical protein
MNKIFKVLEIVWLVLGCIGICLCAYNIITKDNEGAVYFLAFTVVSGIMYAVRKRQRVKFENAQKQTEQKQ